MFTSVSSRSAAAYKRASIEASVDMADPHQLVNLLFEALQRAIGSAKLAMQAGDVTGQVQANRQRGQHSGRGPESAPGPGKRRRNCQQPATPCTATA